MHMISASVWSVRRNEFINNLRDEKCKKMEAIYQLVKCTFQMKIINHRIIGAQENYGCDYGCAFSHKNSLKFFLFVCHFGNLFTQNFQMHFKFNLELYKDHEKGLMVKKLKIVKVFER